MAVVTAMGIISMVTTEEAVTDTVPITSTTTDIPLDATVVGNEEPGEIMVEVLPPPPITRGHGNIIKFKSPFDEAARDTVSDMVDDINGIKAPGERMLIEITSDGGAVFPGREMQQKLKSGVSLDTYVPLMAASMGADTFMLGERRYVERDALILFHGVHLGKFSLTEGFLTKVIKQLELEHRNRVDAVDQIVGTLSDSTSEGPATETTAGSAIISLEEILDAARAVMDPRDLGPAIEELRVGVERAGYLTVMHSLRSTRDMLAGINNGAIDKIVEAMKATRPGITAAQVRKEVFKDFEQDVVLTGNQMLEMGLATHAGRPPEADYTSQ